MLPILELVEQFWSSTTTVSQMAQSLFVLNSAETLTVSRTCGLLSLKRMILLYRTRKDWFGKKRAWFMGLGMSHRYERKASKLFRLRFDSWASF